MSQQYNILIQRLDKFIRRYYKNKLLKGLILFFTGISVLFLIFILIEFLGYFNQVVRAVLFYTFVIFSSLIFVWFVALPVGGLVKIGRRISFDDAAQILGKHFKKEINDKIINTIQLRKVLQDKKINEDLLVASIEQKSGQLALYPFQKAINFHENYRFIPYVLLLTGIIVIGWFLFPYFFKEPAQRIVRYDTHFERPAPFQVNIMNSKPLTGVKNERFTLKTKVEGRVLPSEMRVSIRNTKNKMVSTGRNTFEYEFRNLNEPVEFYIKANSFAFGPYYIDLVNRAIIKNFSLVANYPAYTNKGRESFVNIGDINVPEGTHLKWELFTDDTDSVFFTFPHGQESMFLTRSHIFEFEHIVEEGFEYSLIAMNNMGETSDTLNYSIHAIKDKYPEIQVDEHQDSVLISHLFFDGIIRDDYGFTGLSFHYSIQENGSEIDQKSKDIPFDENNINQSFNFHWDLNEVDIGPGQYLEYYFEVTDNDLFNGPKSTQSKIFSFSIPSREELLAETTSSEEAVKSGLGESIREINQVQNEIDQLRRSMLESDEITWEQQEALKDLLDKQQQSQENYEQLKQFNEEQNIRDQQFSELNQDILNKQQQLEQLFEEVLSDEMKELYQQIQEELDKLDRESIFESLDQMQFEMEDLENRLDRALELFKQLQVERMLTESIDAVEKVKEKQDQLKDQIDKGETGIETGKDEQKGINEEFDQVSDMIEDMLQKNQELTRPNDFEDTSHMQEHIQELLNEVLEQMNMGDMNQAENMQQDASDQMQNLGERLQNMLMQMQQENLAEDIRTLREILDNLIKTSFAQEDLMDKFRAISIRDPKYFDLIQDQRKIANDLEMIKDSLNALAKRQIQIQSFVNREIAEINLNIDQGINQLINRRKHTALSRQQFVMTHVNNLALLLNESMQNMEMQMQMQGQGGDPQQTQGEPSFQDLRQMQEQMNEMLEQLREGHQPMPGESGEQQMSMSEQLARMAAEQEAIRSRLNELSRELRKDGIETKELDEIMREMEDTEMDIVTDNINRQTQMRQQRILTRLLEHERAELEREKEETRVGETAKSYDLSNPEDYFQYNREKNKAIEMLRSLPPGLRSYYQSLVEIYFLNVEQ